MLITQRLRHSVARNIISIYRIFLPEAVYSSPQIPRKLQSQKANSFPSPCARPRNRWNRCVQSPYCLGCQGIVYLIISVLGEINRYWRLEPYHAVIGKVKIISTQWLEIKKIRPLSAHR